MRQPSRDPTGDPVIVQNNASGLISYWQRGDNHSQADRNGVSLADYVHAMFGFIRQIRAREVLMIGGGGGTLATMLSRAGIAVTVVDIDAHSFEIARRYFHMPDTVACHAGDGVAYLRKHRARYDAIALDAYTDGNVPRQFLSKKFFDLARSRLQPGGVFMMNLLVKDDDDSAPDDIVRLMRQSWRHTRLLDCDGWIDRNAVALAGNVAHLKRPRILMRPSRGARKLAADLAPMQFRALRR